MYDDRINKRKNFHHPKKNADYGCINLLQLFRIKYKDFFQKIIFLPVK